MANQEHVDLLKKGVKAWNQWRKEHPEIYPDLRGIVPLEGVNLSKANLKRANFSYADLRGVNLSEADLSYADLTRTRFSNCSLKHANLSYANLTRVIFRSTSFRDANLSEAQLSRAEFNGCKLNGANLTKARVGSTLFGKIDLSQTKGLETVWHSGPSTIGIDTIYLSEGKIPEIFLQGAGVPDSFIIYTHSLVGHPVNYYSCFISYSSKDEALARRLHTNLQAKGVRCWFAPEDMKIGDKIRTQIGEAIHLQDKLLLLLSEHSITSTWVEDEVEAALEKEQNQHRNVLFPVRLDESVMETSQAWAAMLRRSRHIGDFSNWTDLQAYQMAFKRLLEDLKKTDEQQDQETKQ